MATFNSNASDVLSTSLAAAAAAEHFERSAAAAAAATTFIVPASATSLESFVAAAPHFVTSHPHHHHQQQQLQQHHHHQQQTNSSSSYTFVQIKREPCQVSEVTTSNNNCHQQQQQQQQSQQLTTTHHHGLGLGCHSSSSSSASASLSSTTLNGAKTMSSSSSSSTLTTLVKIEASSPKVHELDKAGAAVATLANVSANGPSTNNSVPIGIAVARKRPQESSSASVGSASLCNPSALSTTVQQSLNKDMNCFGIRVADLGGVGNGCGNIYFTGNGDLMTTGSTTSEELALSAAGVQSVNRAPSTYWQYPNALPIESVISMSPATVGLQYSREASRGQVVLLPATAAALGISNFPLYTPTDPFQQAAAAFVWPSYIPQGSAPAAAAAAIQPPPNFLFPSAAHSTLQQQPYATSLQLFGSNYLTAAAAAAAASAAAATTLCQHNQQQQQQQTNSSSSSTSSINLSLSSGGGIGSLGTASSSSSSTSSRFLSMTTGIGGSVGGDKQPKHLSMPSVPLPLPLPLPLPPPLLLPPTAMKIEDWSGAADFMAAAKTTTTTLAAAQMMTPPTPLQHQQPPPLNYDIRGGGHDKTNSTTTATTNHQQQQQHLLELQSGNNTQALNLMRLPTPPSSATIENAAVAAAAPQLQTQLLFQTTGGGNTVTTASTSTTDTPTLLNLSAALTRAPPTPTPQPLATNQPQPQHFLNNNAVATNLTATLTPLDDNSTTALNFKTVANAASSFESQIVVGVPRVVSNAPQQPPPQMQDVNIQTDTPVCSEDENSSCPLAIQQQQQQLLPPHNTQPHETYATAHSQSQHDNSYTSADNTQQPLELIKSNGNICEKQPQETTTSAVAAVANNACHNDIGTGAICAESTTNNSVTQQETQAQHHQLDTPMSPAEFHAADALNVIATAASAEQTAPEDLTGLELLSNISTSTLAVKTGATATGGTLIRVKLEPLDHGELSHSLINAAANTNCTSPLPLSHMCSGGTIYEPQQATQQQHSLLPPPPPVVNDSMGGLNLLCTLAEQRLQEEVQCNSGLFATSSSSPLQNDLPLRLASSTPPPPSSTFTFQQQQQQHQHAAPVFQQSLEQSPAPPTAAFPSMAGIELPSTLSVVGGELNIKRKKHKHSKSNRSASNANVASSSGSKKSSSSSSSCAKKSKKKFSKEKRKHRLAAQLSNTAVGGGEGGGGVASDELDFDDEQLQAEFKNAFNCVDPTQRYGKWPNPEEIFSIMESNMRMRLADINRQYRKKKRKLDEISKNKKKKKCSKLAAAAAANAAQQQQTAAQLLAASALSAAAATATSSSGTCGVGSGASLPPLCDYKFAKFSSQSNVSVATYLNPSSAFLRFADAKTASAMAPQFPPPAAVISDASACNDEDCTNATSSLNTVASYKPVRLEPSTLAANADLRNSASSSVIGPARHAQKHTLTERSRGEPKERKLSRRTSDEDETTMTTTSTAAEALAAASKEHQDQKRSPSLSPQPASRAKSPTPMDRNLTLTSEHLYRKETRVLTDMGGLFYAGIMKPLQPPDVYAITLDGERGNKSHIMSREEIFKDTILEVAPKSVDCVPIGTRLCAYWSQQYRCLYPGRAIESESSEDGAGGGGGGGSSTSAAASAHDFVSVEFDDGDSGRIRLQNIRLLLSDYPIVEYNDNPLYSLGKQKKSSVKSSGNTSDPHHQHDHSSSAAEDNQHHHHQQQNQNHHLLPTQQAISSRGVNTSNNIGIGDSGAVTSEMHPSITRELYAQRSEKKRIKNLKKKTQAAAAAAAAMANGATTSLAANTALTTSGGGTAADDGSRKHHKHKKRKKHKKHHHRKGAGNTNNNNNNTYIINTAAAGAPASYVSKRELPMDEHNAAEHEHDEEDDEEEQQHEDTAVQLSSSHDSRESNETHKVSPPPPPIKMEVSAAMGNSIAAAGSGNGNVKVKTEHLDLEEETTSNLMSEISDEVKADDEVEHNNSKGSKIAAFLPERQLWGWQGKAYRKAGVKGRARKQFFKSIKRGKETITVGDCAVFLSTGRPDRPYIGRIESMWETTSSNKVVRVRWFYHPEETTGCPNLKYPGALFESPHEDENDVQTISHRCEVLQFLRYFGKFGADSKQYQSIYDNNDTYYLAGYYNPRLQVLKLQDDIPTLEEQNNTTDV